MERLSKEKILVLKTADIFAKILNKELKVKFVNKGFARTDKNQIYLPVNKDMYTLLNHEIAHMFFTPDNFMYYLRNFMDDFGKTYEEKKYLFFLVSAVEDVRVNSWWKSIYAGAGEKIDEYNKRTLSNKEGVIFNVLRCYYASESSEDEMVQECVSLLKRVRLAGWKETFAVASAIYEKIKAFGIPEIVLPEEELEKVEKESPGFVLWDKMRSGDNRREKRIVEKIDKFSVSFSSEDSDMRYYKDGEIKIKRIRKDGNDYKMKDADISRSNRLREIFNRIIEKEKNMLFDEGDEVDVDEFIQGKAQKRQVECLVDIGRKRGFNVCFLLDLSGSMWRFLPELSRISCILRQAMEYTFVDFDFVGFNSLLDKPIIYLFDRDVRNFSIKKEPNFLTPLHLGLRVAIERLNRKEGKKILCVFTDGDPVFCDENEKYYSEALLQELVRKEMRLAYCNNVDVNVFITSMKGADQRYRGKWNKMFGNRWQFSAGDEWERNGKIYRLDGVLDLVSRKFIEWLQNF